MAVPGHKGRGVDDWASLPALLLLLSIFFFIANPIGSAFSRQQEHQADQYGLEVTHGLTPDSDQVAAQAFNLLGEVDLIDPEPNPADMFLFTHPSRIACNLLSPANRGRTAAPAILSNKACVRFTGAEGSAFSLGISVDEWLQGFGSASSAGGSLRGISACPFPSAGRALGFPFSRAARPTGVTTMRLRTLIFLMLLGVATAANGATSAG